MECMSNYNHLFCGCKYMSMHLYQCLLALPGGSRCSNICMVWRTSSVNVAFITMHFYRVPSQTSHVRVYTKQTWTAYPMKICILSGCVFVRKQKMTERGLKLPSASPKYFCANVNYMSLFLRSILKEPCIINDNEVLISSTNRLN